MWKGQSQNLMALLWRVLNAEFVRGSQFIPAQGLKSIVYQKNLMFLSANHQGFENYYDNCRS